MLWRAGSKLPRFYDCPASPQATMSFVQFSKLFTKTGSSLLRNLARFAFADPFVFFQLYVREIKLRERPVNIKKLPWVGVCPQLFISCRTGRSARCSR